MPSKDSLYGMFLIHKFWTVFHYDYLDCFIPFIVAPLRDNSTKNLKEIKEAIKKEFHFDIPTHPLAAIITRARKRKAIFAEYKRYTINPDKANKFDLLKNVATYQRKYEGVILELISYIKSKCTISYSDENIESGFLDFLSAHEKEILDSFGDVLRIQEVKNRKVLKYHISQFILKAHENDHDLHSAIVEISIGQMLTSALFNVHDEQGLEKFKGNLSSLKVFFDSRFLLRILGIEGRAHQDSAEELVTSLRGLSAKCYFCKTTEDELNNILWYSAECFKGTTKGHKANKLRLQKNGFDESKIDFIYSDVQGRLREHNIFYNEKIYDEYDQQYQIDEGALYENVKTIYSKNNTSFSEDAEKERIERDCSVIAEVYQVRKMQSPTSLSKANAIFVTTNTGLPQACRIFDDTISQRGKSIISPVVTDTFIGTIIWVQNPPSVRSISDKRIIALVNAALQPELECIEKYIDFAEQLRNDRVISQDAYTLAVAHRVAINVLEDYTCGCADSLELSTVEEIIHSIEEKIKHGESLKTDQERSQKERAISQKEAITSQLKNTEKQLNATVDYVQKQAEKLVNPILYSFKTAFYFIVLTGIGLSIFKIEHWSKYVFISILAIITFLNLKRGWTIDNFFRNLSMKLSKAIAEFFTHQGQS